VTTTVQSMRPASSRTFQKRKPSVQGRRNSSSAVWPAQTERAPQNNEMELSPAVSCQRQLIVL